jgi:TonB-dependent SusC/RagA subfamily outer membrane receptor
MTPSLRRAALSAPILVLLTTDCASGGVGAKPASDKSAVTADDITTHPSEPIEKLLQNKVPGVVVTRTSDGTIALRIRGSSSLDGRDSPLFVIDGLPVEAGPEGGLTGVDPYSIETIKVLKGAEAAIYGIRGVNGVIVITTKQPGKRKR